MILRLAFFKMSYLKYIGHLDLVRLFQRAFNKAEIDLAYSQGFNPHPKFSIANPLSLGIESEEEYMDIELNTEIPAEEFMEKMNAVLPRGIQITRGAYVEDKRAVASIIDWALYEITFETESIWDRDALQNKIEDYLDRDEIIITKRKRKKRRKIEVEVDVRNLIREVELKEIGKNKISLEALLKSGGNGNLKPLKLIKSLKAYENIDIDLDSVNIKRTGLFVEEKGEIVKPI